MATDAIIESRGARIVMPYILMKCVLQGISSSKLVRIGFVY